jgi:uncharacterized C2H2 Zn-finger protein
MPPSNRGEMKASVAGGDDPFLSPLPVSLMEVVRSGVPLPQVEFEPANRYLSDPMADRLSSAPIADRLSSGPVADYSCRVCGMLLSNRKNAARHRRKCERNCHLQCSVCGQEFYRRDVYTTHMKTKHGLLSHRQ